MRWLLSEYILKGVFLGLLLFLALQQPTWLAIGGVFLCILGGLGLCLGIAGYRKIREGYKVAGKVPAFVLFLLLESPQIVYAGIILGTLVGIYAARGDENREGFVATFLGGAVVGLCFWAMRHVADRNSRFGLSLALAVALVCGGYYWFGYLDHPIESSFATVLLLGIPVFYLLTFAGIAEESEVEIGAMCATLGMGSFILARQSGIFSMPAVLFIVPLGIFFVYTKRILPGLRVFKYVVRGIGYANVGRNRPALVAFRRALTLDPNNKLARQHLWALHRQMDLKDLIHDPDTLALVDLDLCLARASTLLLEPKPDEAKRQEAEHLLDLVQSQRPALAPIVTYWQAVALTHAKQLEAAAGKLTQLLDPANHALDDANRKKVLLQAWLLALTLHPELNRRVGAPQLAMPGRRLEAIAAVERCLAEQPEATDAWSLKRLLYSNLTEDEYVTATKDDGTAPSNGAPAVIPRVLPLLDYGYTHQLGLALINDPARWQRGAEYLQISARGLPANSPSIYHQVAQAYERAGDVQTAQHYYQRAKQAGRAVGVANLSPEDKQLYFTLLKQLGDQARAKGDIDAAIENYQLYTEYERAGLETLRILADLYEKRGDAMAALRVTEKALLYDGADKDLLARKEKYYYSVTPDQLRANLETIRNAFDVTYCQTKATQLLGMKDADLELIDWAQHLADLAAVLLPNSIGVKVLQARALRRRGETAEAQKMLESARTPKPESFSIGAEEEAWFLACRLLGEMYLYDLGKPDLAIPCFNDFRGSHKSGADTMYKLGQCYEQLGDPVKARKCYEHVTAYESHPLAPDARDALYRLQSS
jgi:tetratricopeptide (TPR) repeat protein